MSKSQSVSDSSDSKRLIASDSSDSKVKSIHRALDCDCVGMFSLLNNQE